MKLDPYAARAFKEVPDQTAPEPGIRTPREDDDRPTTPTCPRPMCPRHSQRTWPSCSASLFPSRQRSTRRSWPTAAAIPLREAAEQVDEHVALVVGGYHLAWRSIEQISELARTLKAEFQVSRVAPAHCSGHTAFKVFQEVFSEEFVFFGLGSQIELAD